MSQNVVYLLGEKCNGKIFDINKQYFKNEIDFASFFPARYVAENFRNREMGDKYGEYYVVVECEVLDFSSNQLTVAYEEFKEMPPF